MRNWLARNFDAKSKITSGKTIREYFFKVNPKFVLWFHYEGNDFDDLKKELNSKILNKYLINENFTQKLALKQKEIDTKLNKYLSVNEKNISMFSKIYDINGFLIGGSSQSSKKFIDIIRNYYK